MSDARADLPAWQDLLAVAEEEVKATLGSLPKKLRQPALALPVSYERRPNAALVAEGLAEDTLGLFVGGEFAEVGGAVLPPQIILFLENIWEMVDDEDGDEEDYRFEIRTTLLHELGHYLGLNEDELWERGLE